MVRSHLDSRLKDYASRRTYRLWGVHVRVTSRKMGSVCGEHDFIDLVGLNNAIFWGCKREIHEVQSQDRGIMHNPVAEAESH